MLTNPSPYVVWLFPEVISQRDKRTQSKYAVSKCFNVSDLSPYYGDDDEMDESRTTLSQGEGDDTARPMDNASSTPPSPPSGPMTRSRAKALHDKVNSFLYMCDLDPTVDGTLPHANALCILRFEPLHRLHGSMKDGREDGQASTKKDHFGAGV